MLLTLLLSISLLLSHRATAFTSVNHTVIQNLLINEANRQGIDPALALAMAEVESNFNAKALSKAGAKGVMQIMPETAKTVFGVSSSQLYDAKINISLGISFIKQLLARYNQRLDIALSHYNGGSAVQNKSGRLSVIPATANYVNKVLLAKDKFTHGNLPLLGDSDSLSYSEPLNDNYSLGDNYFKTASKAKTVMKPKKYYINTSFENSLYQKVEQLRNLRLHNIMRNTKSKTPLANKMTYTHPRLPKFNKQYTANKQYSANKVAITPSEKRNKVLAWEEIFN